MTPEEREEIRQIVLEYVRSPEFKKELKDARDSRNGRRRVL